MNDDELVRRFLLRELTEDETERVEERLLREDELFDLCEAVEADLLEAAARGELAPAERDRILERLASSPQGRARLALARDLAAFADGKMILPAPLPFPRPDVLTMRPAFRWALAAGLAAILLGGIGGGIWSFLANNGPGDRSDLATKVPPSEQGHRPGQDRTNPGPDLVPVDPDNEATDPGVATPPPDQSQDQVPLETDEPPARDPLIVELSLLAALRSGEGPEAIEKIEEIEIPSGRDVELHVPHVVTVAGFDSYDAVVKRGDEKFFRFEPRLVRQVDNDLVLDLPASTLPVGRYKVEVYGNSAGETPELLVEQELEVSGGG